MKKTKNKKIVFLIIAIVSIITLGIIGGIVWYNSKSSGINPSDLNYVSLGEGFTNVSVKDKKTAINAISSVGEMIGITDTEKELKITEVYDIDGVSYYRMQQYYKDIPVYGRKVTLCADEDGRAIALTSNTTLIDTELEEEQEIEQKKVIKKITKYISKELNADIDNVAVSDKSWDEKIIYNIGEAKRVHLARCLEVTFSVDDNNDTYEVIVDCNNGEVLAAKTIMSGVATTVYSKDGKKSTVGWKNDAGKYKLYNDQYKIKVFDFKGKNLARNKVKLDFKEYGCKVIVSKTDKFDEKGIVLLDSLFNISKYFDDLGDPGFELINAAINDGFQSGRNARGGGSYDGGNRVAVLCVGKKIDVSDIDTIAHEYSHAVSSTIVGWSGKSAGETGALNEAYSDILGELIEEKITGKEKPDWRVTEENIGVDRNIANPREGKFPAKVSDENNSGEDYVHGYSTVISHAAYLMWNGIDGNYKKIDSETLAKMWYRSLPFMHSDETFSQCRNAVELSARIMLKNEDITKEQYETVVKAFEKVGIEETFSDYGETVKNEFDLSVVSSKETENLGFNLTIYKMPASNTDKIKKVMNKNYRTGNQHIKLDNGTYILQISDLDTREENTSKVISTKIVVKDEDEKATNKVTIYTDFTDILTVILDEDDKKEESDKREQNEAEVNSDEEYDNSDESNEKDKDSEEELDKKSNESSDDEDETSGETQVEQVKEETEEETEKSSLSEDDLKDKMQDSVNYEIAEWYYEDFDNNGVKEAYCIVAETYGEEKIIKGIYYIDSDGNVETMRTDFWGGYFIGKVSAYDGKVFLSVDTHNGGSSGITYLFGVRYGDSYELKISGEINGFDVEGSNAYATLEEFEQGHQYLSVALDYDSDAQEFSLSE